MRGKLRPWRTNELKLVMEYSARGDSKLLRRLLKRSTQSIISCRYRLRREARREHEG